MEIKTYLHDVKRLEGQSIALWDQISAKEREYYEAQRDYKNGLIEEEVLREVYDQLDILKNNLANVEDMIQIKNENIESANQWISELKKVKN